MTEMLKIKTLGKSTVGILKEPAGHYSLLITYAEKEAICVISENLAMLKRYYDAAEEIDDFFSLLNARQVV